MEENKKDDKLMQIQKELWDVVNQYLGPQDVTILYALSGSMLKIAIELYTTVLKDEDIESMLGVATNDIPKMRQSMVEKVGQRTLH
jgi:hypothetical protein|tara:strand:- start:286 stop:543 length:258 start_codon:yes stop_codon:yes gene_type:complete